MARYANLKKEKNREAIFLTCLFRQLGGLTAISKKLGGLCTNTISNWRKRGVSIRYLLKISKAFQLPPELFSERASQVTGSIWSFEKRVKASPLDARVKANILKVG